MDQSVTSSITIVTVPAKIRTYTIVESSGVCPFCEVEVRYELVNGKFVKYKHCPHYVNGTTAGFDFSPIVSEGLLKT